MGFFTRFVLRIALSAGALYIAQILFPNFRLDGGISILLASAFLIAVLNSFLRPVIRFFTKPLIWITFGLFNVLINLSLLWIADQLIAQLVITDLTTLFWISAIVGIANSII